jgi:hypothetical protein
MIGADSLQPLLHHLEGQGRAIAFPAQVPQVKMLHFGRDDLFDSVGSGFVREVAVPAKNALLEAPRPVRTFLQHFDVVIGLQQEHMGATNALQRQSRRMPEVSEESNTSCGSPQQKAHWVLCIVRDGKSLYEDVAHLETRAGVEKTTIELGPELVLRGLLRRPVAINRDPQFCAQGGQALDMVRVFVRDEDAGQVFWRPADRRQTLPNLAQAEPGIDQDAGFVGFHISAIPVGTAAKNCQANRHSRNASDACKGRQCFSAPTTKQEAG